MSAQPEASALAPELEVQCTVPRELVHKAAISEVLLADSRQVGDYACECVGQLPRNHSFHNDSTSGHHDPLTVLEAVRQAGVLIAHRHLGVPEGRQFIFGQIELAIDDLGALSARGHPPALHLAMAFDDPKVRRGELVGGSMRCTVSVEGRQAMQIHGDLSFVSQTIYARFRREAATRSHRTPPPVERTPPKLVGRSLPANVVIGALDASTTPGEVRATVVVDQSHPTFFDHPLDHVPGMLLVEATRQTATAGVAELCGLEPATSLVTAFALRFVSVAELGAPLHCVARVLGRERASVELETELIQEGDEVGRGLVSLRDVAHERLRWAV
jgi:hypothetical protein